MTESCGFFNALTILAMTVLVMLIGIANVLIEIRHRALSNPEFRSSLDQIVTRIANWLRGN